MLMNHTNQTEDDLFSCYSPSVVGYRYFAVLWGCAVTITGMVGNLMTILAFALDPRLRTRFNVLIINLAVADFMCSTVLQPFSADSYLHLRWRSGQLWCSIFGLLLFVSGSVSIITLCLIAVGRYLLVAKRAVFDRVFSDRGLILLLISAWALGLASFGPLWTVYVFVPKVCICSFHRTKARPFVTIVLFLYFFISLGVVGMFYFLIYRRVRIASRALLRYRLSNRSSRKKPASSAQGIDESSVETKTCSCELSSQVEQTQNMEEITCEQSSEPAQSSAMASNSSEANKPPADIVPMSSVHSKASRDVTEMQRVTHMCLAVFLCFVLCCVPYMLLNSIDRHDRAPQILYMFCGNLLWLSSCINPVLYAVMNRQFRQAYHVLITRAAAPFTCLWTRWSTLGS